MLDKFSKCSSVDLKIPTYINIFNYHFKNRVLAHTCWESHLTLVKYFIMWKSVNLPPINLTTQLNLPVIDSDWIAIHTCVHTLCAVLAYLIKNGSVFLQRRQLKWRLNGTVKIRNSLSLIITVFNFFVVWTEINSLLENGLRLICFFERLICWLKITIRKMSFLSYLSCAYIYTQF
jgi:hypothetical protein